MKNMEMVKESRLTELPLEKLQLDSDNPRLPERLKGSKEKYILEWMLEDASLLDLMASILENGFFPGEPLIGIQSSEKDKVAIIEGNRRLAACKLLNNPQLTSVRRKTIDSLLEDESLHKNIPSELPVYICPDRKSIQNYLGFRHVSGIKSWDVLSKARYLYSLYEQKDKNDPGLFKKLAKEIGSKSNYVKRLIYGFEMFLVLKENNFFGINEINEDNYNFSLLTDSATMNANISRWLNLDFAKKNPVKEINKENLKQLSKWLYEKDENGATRIGDSRNIRQLNRLIENKEAFALFARNQAGLREALELTAFSDDIIADYINKAYNYLGEAQRILHKSSNPSSYDIDRLNEMKSMINIILRVFEEKLNEKK
ncbi:MAG: ParB N-terminal domain-containing protein [Lewinellaceae bacterium]|nr:ParB N-terminal domain-containing protein [Lewinellaceae bacterium]